MVAWRTGYVTVLEDSGQFLISYNLEHEGCSRSRLPRSSRNRIRVGRARGIARACRLYADGRVHPNARAHALPRHHCPVVELAGDEREIEAPKLFGIYLRYGALVLGPPAIDHEFGTIDFLTVVENSAELRAQFGERS